MAKKNNLIVKISKDDLFCVQSMNMFIGNKYSTDEIKEMLDNNKKIKIDNERYQELLKTAKFTFPITFVNSDTVPTLCLYGGKDSLVGLAQYSYLKELSEKFGNKIELVYMKYGGHMLDDYKTQDGINSMRESHYQILEFAKNYFTYED